MRNCIEFRHVGLNVLVLMISIVGSPSLSAQTMSGGESESNSEKVSFDAVQPILRKHCVRCHNEDQPRGDLVLSSLDKVLAGSSSGPVVVASKLDESPLYTLTAHLDTPKMPPNKPQIPQRELNVIERWIMSGLAEETKTASPSALESNKPSMNSKPQEQVSKPQTGDLSPAATTALRPLPQASAVRVMAAHPSEPIVVIAGLQQIAILDTLSNKFASQAIEIGERSISALRFSPDGKFLLAGVGIVGESGTVLVLDWSTKRWLPSVGEESDNIQSLDCNSDASQIAIGTTTRTVKTFDRLKQRELHSHRKHTDWVLSVAYSDDGLLLASGDRFGGIHVWESETGNEFASLRGHTAGIVGLVWSNNGDKLFSASLDGTVRIWNMHTLESVKQIDAHERGVLSLARGPKESIFTTGRDGWVRKWDLETAKSVGQSKLPDEAISVQGIGGVASLGALICSDVAGGLYRFDSLPVEENNDVSGIVVSWPLMPQKRVFASNAPAPLKRVMISDTKDIARSHTAKAIEAPANSQAVIEKADAGIASDLEESRRALASVEQSLEQAYRTAEQLEESVARLKQLIVLQEARLKQAELRQKPNRK